MVFEARFVSREGKGFLGQPGLQHEDCTNGLRRVGAIALLHETGPVDDQNPVAPKASSA